MTPPLAALRSQNQAAPTLPGDAATLNRSGDRKLWLCVGLAFGLLFCAWTILFTVAGRNRIATVPLATTANTVGSPAPHVTTTDANAPR